VKFRDIYLLKIDCIESVQEILKEGKKKKKRFATTHAWKYCKNIYEIYGSLFKKKIYIKWEASLFIVLWSIRVKVHTYRDQFNPSVKYPTRVRPIRIYAVSIIGTCDSARFLAFVNIWHVTMETNTVSI